MSWIPLLLTDPSPCLRYLVLKELVHREEDDQELNELSQLRDKDPLVTELVKLQKPSGAWDSFSNSRIANKDNITLTSMALQRLGYFGYDKEHASVKKAAEFLFSKQEDDGAWPMPGKKDLIDEEVGYQMMPIQTAIPLLGLAMTGHSTDKRAEKAYDWLLEQKLDDGAWPVGISAGNYGGIAGYRHLAHSKFGCRSNTTTVLTCFAYHPKRKNSEQAKRALDHVLGTDMMLRSNLGYTIARLIGLEKSFGRITYMAKFDIAHLLDLCWRIGANLDDERVQDFIDFIKEQQGKYGLWEYASNPKATRWLSFDILRSLSQLDKASEWISMEPKTPFQAYSKKVKRY